MNAMLEMARKENVAVRRGWEVGGSVRYPASLPPRPRPKPEPQMEATPSPPEEGLNVMPAFDEALEHANWCRSRGMSPQDMCRSINSLHNADTWGGAIALLERFIERMRAAA